MATCKNCIHYLVCNLKGAGCRDENGVFGNETITMIQSVEVERNCEEYLPSDVAPVKHGDWVEYETKSYKNSENGIAKKYYRCSNCRYFNAIRSNYCPKCGAKMDGGD